LQRRNRMGETEQIRTLVLSQDTVVGDTIANEMSQSAGRSVAKSTSLGSSEVETAHLNLVVISPGEAPEIDRPERIAMLKKALQTMVARSVDKVILISSGAIIGPDHNLIGFVSEEAKKRPAIINHYASWWELVEETVQEEIKAAPGLRLTVIRCPFLIGGDGNCFIDRVIKRGWLVRCAGFNPPLQFVSVTGLAAAVRHASERNLEGIYNLAPEDVVPLLPALKALGVRSIGIPRVIQRVFRPILFQFLDRVKTTDEIEYFRYPWTISGEKLAADTGLQMSSREALTEAGANVPEDWPEFDGFGSDQEFFTRHGKTTFRLAEKAYWRIESRGFKNIPTEGSAIMVGPHRGFMPLDAVMIFHLIYRNIGRRSRFLIHPTLAKFPFQGLFFQRMATLIACKENARRVLESGELLGVYPEGIRGTFKRYKEVYDLGRFGRPDYARFALEFDVPVVPFAIVGSAEIFPILGKIEWKWLKKYLEWPFVPITPTFPLLPVPLPTKWHVDFLSPIHPSDVRRQAEEQGKDPVRVYTDLVRNAIHEANQEILAQRKSIYWGRVWK
jgi:1-acyl-sn-glycerol-3-phosphate acyltransferase